MVAVSSFELDGFGNTFWEIRLMPIFELQILSPIRGVGLCIIVFYEGACTSNQEEFHQFLPVFLTITSFKRLDATYKVLVLLGKLPFTTNLTDIGLRANTQIGFIVNKQTQLTAQILILLIVRCCSQQ